MQPLSQNDFISVQHAIPFDPIKLAKHANLKSPFQIVPDRDLKKEASAITPLHFSEPRR
jgi:hypothetical protein